MTVTAAAQILELPPDSAPEQIESRFLELRAKLEDRIAKAPTPGLKAKYRESLDEITQAFETLTLAADASHLPMAKRKETGAPETGDRGKNADRNLEAGERIPAAVSANRKSRIENRKSSKEFAIVALLALALLGGGAWWVMKVRAEKAEAARIAAEQKAEQDRQAAAAQAERERLAEEKRRHEAEAAAAAQAERERIERKAADIRVALAELGLLWQAGSRELQEAERRLGDLKSELRSLREPSAADTRRLNALVAAHQRHVDWLRDFLAEHPGRRLQVRTEQLLAARQFDDAAAELEKLQRATADFREQLSLARKRVEAELYGEVAIKVADTVDRWSLVDVFGRRFDGVENTLLSEVAAGRATLTMHRAGWNEQTTAVDVKANARVEAVAAVQAGALSVASVPTNAEVWQQGRRIGQTPFKLENVQPGKWQFVLRAPGFLDRTITLDVVAERIAEATAELEKRIPPAAEVLDDFTRRAQGVWMRKINATTSGYMRIVAGSRQVESKGKYMGVTSTLTSTLTVPDPATGEVFFDTPNASGKPYMVLKLVGGQLQIEYRGTATPTYVMERVHDSAW
jgi:hypothetical protein